MTFQKTLQWNKSAKPFLLDLWTSDEENVFVSGKSTVQNRAEMSLYDDLWEKGKVK